MKLGVKITLIVVAVFLLAVIIAISVCAGIAGRINDKTKPIDALSEWLSYIEDETPLKSIAIPGSHDSGSENMIWFSKTQSRDIADQLACGTRYFDVRVKMKKGECRIYHGPAYGLYLKDVLRDVRDFLIANPSETVILDVHKFGNGEAKAKTAELLDEYLLDMFVEKADGQSDLEFVENLTLGEVRGKCMLVWGEEDEYASDNRYFVRNDDHGDVNVGCLQSFYTKNWNWYYSSEKYIEKAIPAYIEMYKNSRGGLFVLQGQLTDGALIIGPRYREGCHEKNMNDCVVSLADDENLQYINIVMRDYISPIKNCYTLTLNVAKGVVKDECSDDYARMIADVVNGYA
ncbi:MAG: phosphatidylinositol-specific phospholipase C domain-containing protein [Bacteroides sp.]|nr:phosphatidylinositol-specific phospholipase C domain-containing protein [Bacillota bacterium]MCM1393840.1 phosphatidylinositol-specific phospholipase C domain-containing protein [[Eubacterium] siraeum]MCM1455977.1 phosphatidylinositol-specific phospholipase C domain-containing protein [Bacteroides sp.]